jgi:hypothetical protein
VFCGDCGVRLYHNPKANEAITIVKLGTLDDLSWLRPVGHVWTRGALMVVRVRLGTRRFIGRF